MRLQKSTESCAKQEKELLKVEAVSPHWGSVQDINGRAPQVLEIGQPEAWDGEEQEYLAEEFLIHVQVKGKKAYITSTGFTIS